MIRRSLRVRLMLGAAVAITVALAVAWLLMILLFQRHLERRLTAEMTAQAAILVAQLQQPRQGPLSLERDHPDPRYDTPASGHYWQVSAGPQVLRSRSLWDQTLPGGSAANGSAWSTRSARGPFEQDLIFVERKVRFPNGQADVLIQMAKDAASVRLARREFGQELGLFLVILGIVLSLAAWVQVQMGLRPLAGIRRDLDRLKDHSSERLQPAPLAEIEPLVTAINSLAEAREADLKRARRRVADLAHGLKTPLSALSAQSRALKRADKAEATDGLDRAIEAMSRTVERELARTRVTTMQLGMTGRSAPASTVERLVAVLKRTEDGEAIRFEIDIPCDARAPLAEEDLAELLGALLENAARHAQSRVRITGGTAGELMIDDDGPAAPAAALIDAFSRCDRADEGTGGLGLSIARELAEVSGGRLDLMLSPLGGLRVRIQWRPDSIRLGFGPTGR